MAKKIIKKEKQRSDVFKKESKPNCVKISIAVSGAAETGHCAMDAVNKAEAIGREIGNKNMILITGATTGIPYWSAKGAKEAGGTVIGFSPAGSELAHVKTYQLPMDYHDSIVYTGQDYTGRDLLLMKAAHGIIIICGRIGTLHEFTVAFEDKKPIGVLIGSGGTADIIENLVKTSHRGLGKIVYSSDPKELVEKLVDLIEGERKILGTIC